MSAVAGQFPKQHACSTHDNVRAITESVWPTLALCGRMDLEEDGDQRLELRNCADCHSTIAVEVMP